MTLFDALNRLESHAPWGQRETLGAAQGAHSKLGDLPNESAGKHRSGQTRKGNRWLRTALVEAAAGASRAKNSARQARFRRVLRHRGPKKAIVAVAHALLRMVYHVLAEGTLYREAGADYYDRHRSQRLTRRALQTLERQGYRVTLEPAA